MWKSNSPWWTLKTIYLSVIHSNFGLCMQIPCLCGSAPCLLCRCCPSGNNSTVTRLIYAFFLLLGVGIACIMLMPGMEGQLKKVRSVPQITLPNGEYIITLQKRTSLRSVFLLWLLTLLIQLLGPRTTSVWTLFCLPFFAKCGGL